MLISHLKPPDLPFISIFRAVYLATQGNSTYFIWFTPIIKDISKGFITKLTLFSLLGLL